MNNVVEYGQIGMFDISECIKEPIKENKSIKVIDPIQVMINKYIDSCKMITKCIHGYTVYLDNRCLNFNTKGEYKFTSISQDIFPNTEILVSNQEVKLTDKQQEVLKELDPEEYITRKGDSNIYIKNGDKVIYVTDKGVIWNIKIKLKENELCSYHKKPKKVFKIGDEVEVNYNNKTIRGNVVSIYNNGDTVNISYSNGVQPWCTSLVELVS